MSMTVHLGCGHGLQLRAGEDTREENLPGHGPWVFYPVMDEHPVDKGDQMTCLVCLTAQEITDISPGLIPLNDLGGMAP